MSLSSSIKTIFHPFPFSSFFSRQQVQSQHIIPNKMRGDSQRFKKRLNISSLNAAICNVAVFKSMKQRQFRDEIQISYCEQGVLVQAANAEQWQRVSRYVQNFLASKKIALLAFGFEKEVYEELIIKGLKDYTRRMKEMGEECPYINIIHYQKLRKSCEYMDKERYVEPLKDWERKNKKNPNFAFLIVQPAYKFEDVKRRLLESLLKREVPLSQPHLSLLYFLLLFFASPHKDDLREAYEKTYIQLALQRTKDPSWRTERGEFEQYRVRVSNYTALKLGDLDYTIVRSSKHLARLGLQFIPAKEIEAHCRKVKQFLSSTVNARGESLPSTAPFQTLLTQLLKKHGEDYCVIPFKRSEREKYHAVIDKFVTKTQQKDIGEVEQHIQKHVLCQYQDIEFLGEISPELAEQRGYRLHRACLNDCPYLVHAYPRLPLAQIDTFLLYLDQLKTYACTYLLRFYGIAVVPGEVQAGGKVVPADLSAEERVAAYGYCLMFDHRHRTLRHMMDNDMILDNFQAANMVLQLTYLVSFLHTHQEPRSLGELKVDQTYWPLALALPYLRQDAGKQDARKEEAKRGHFRAVGQGFQGDVRLAGQLMKALLETGTEGKQGKEAESEDDHFSGILKMMLKESKYERIPLAKCIATLQELLNLN